jgi:hypothetical protein
MAASDFNIIPTWVQLSEPQFFISQKQSESLIKDRQALSSNPICTAQLQFNGISDAIRKAIYDHFIARKGGYESFAWPEAYVPDYIHDKFDYFIVDVGLTVRWIPGSFQSTPLAHGWNVEIGMLIEVPAIEYSGGRITEEGDNRITEEGDERVLEGDVI